MLTAFGFFLVLFCSWLMTWWLRRYALARSVLDVPNFRSSHGAPVPRGGGMAIVMSCSLAMLVLTAVGWLIPDHLLAMLGAGGLVALIGFLDDHRPVVAGWRLLAHALAAAWGLFWLGDLSALSILGERVQLGWLWAPLGMLYLVWLLNLYNFMDGIDGLAAVEAVIVCLAGALFYALLGEWHLAVLPVVLALSCGGFLIWNFPPARIFMGDGGSGYLGLLLGLLSLQAAFVEPQLFWAWLVMLGVFVVDASLTLVRRTLRGEPPHQAHRSHAYQFASREFGAHLPVTVAVALINICWLLPLSLWVVFGGDGLFIALLAYAPLVALAVKFRAGLAE
jgi:Fuc2NAc and GlcNAc transferase